MRESIFVSALRALCVAFAAMVGIICGGVLLVMALGAFSSGSTLLPEASVMTIEPDAEGDRTVLSDSSPAILKLNIHGVIGLKDNTADKIQDLLLDSREGMLDHNRVKAILIHMDSPGGTVDDADGIYRALIAYKQKYKVPIYVYVDGLCASGGMYISCAADKIYASPPSVIGSVGVIVGPYFNFSGLMDRYGVAARTLTQGKDKDALSPFRPWRPDEDQSIVDITAYLYQQFVGIVTSARPHLDKTKLIEDYGAHVFDVSKAQEFGYIDVAGSDYSAALKDLVAAANIPEKEAYQVVSLEPKRSFFSQFTESSLRLFSGKITHVFQVSPYLDSELSGKLLYLYQP